MNLASKRRRHRRHAVLEITREHLTLGLLRLEDSGSISVTWRRTNWNDGDSGVFAQINAAKVSAAIRQLLGEEKVSGVPLQIVLGGDYCVTRTVAGTQEQVQRELRDLRERSAMYISLGHGSKAFAESVRTIDAKRAQGSMTITNQDSLLATTQAASELGFKTQFIEHSLVSLSRAIGNTGRDANEPVIIIELNRRGVDLGISYQGRLLLDYRPGGLSRLPGEQRQVAQVVLKHLGRIRRYCHRYFQFSGGKISQVLLCGEGEEIEVLKQHFAEATDLTACALTPQEISPEWQLEGISAEDGWTLPCLGALVQATLPAKESDTPDLLVPLLLSQREPLWPALAKRAWPVAAAAILALLGYGAGAYEQLRSSALMPAVTEARAVAELLAARQVELAAAETKMKHLRQLGARLESPMWDEFLADVSHCLPQGAWLETLKVDRSGNVYLFGPSFNEQAVFELVEHLRDVPSVREVVLEATRPARLETGPATLFDVKCVYNGHSEPAEGS